MNSARHLLVELIERGIIPPAKIAAALAISGVTPDSKAWRHFIDRLLLWLAGLALTFALMFFVAYNWSEIGRFAKFAMVEASIALAVFAYWKFGVETTAGKMWLLLAIILLGVLLALYGQTYQTGADRWQLFFTWSILMLPWAIVGRFSAIWILWIILINILVIHYYDTFGGMLGQITGRSNEMLWLIFLLNTLMLAVWEWLSGRWHWLAVRWPVRLVAMAGGISITLVTLGAIFDEQSGVLSGLVWMIWLASVYWVYRKLKPDLFMLAGGCLSGIIVLVAFLSKHTLKSGGAGALLLIFLVVISLGAGAAVWLRKVRQEMHP